MKFAIMVNEGPYTHQSADTAYYFTEAALKAGHEIVRVFFYHDGVNVGTRLSVPPQDDRNISERWSKLATKNDLDMILCVAAAQRRGLLDQENAKRAAKDADNMDSGFEISGLGQLIDAGIQADRLMVFGD